jgi:ABC-type glutathione transport system ATPase component
MKGQPLLEVKNLSVKYFQSGLPFTKRKTINAVKHVSFQLAPLETLALVGESGSGKTSILMAILGFIEPVAGEILVSGNSLIHPVNRQRKGFDQWMQPVFQNVAESLNPRQTLLQTMLDSIWRIKEKDFRMERILQLWESVGLEPEWLQRYPHELSGGQKQRACLARALGPSPGLLLLDEPFSAQDLKQAGSLIRLIQQLKSAFRLSLLIISHDLNLVRYLADRTVILKQGQVVEVEQTARLFENPASAYTRTLLSAVRDYF